MTKKENITQNFKFYSQKAIGIATFIGGPLAAGYLIRENFNTISKPDEGKKSLIIGIISTILLFGGIFIIPENIMDKIPNQLLPLIYTGLVYLIVEHYQGKLLNTHKDNNNEFYSGWKASGIGFISLIIILIGVFGFAFLEPESKEYEQYYTEMAKFNTNEIESLKFYDHLNTENNITLLEELENTSIPNWINNIELISNSNKIVNLPSELLEHNRLLLEYSELRLKVFELYKKSITEDSDKYFTDIENIHLKIDLVVDKMN